MVAVDPVDTIGMGDRMRNFEEFGASIGERAARQRQIPARFDIAIAIGQIVDGKVRVAAGKQGGCRCIARDDILVIGSLPYDIVDVVAFAVITILTICRERE